MNRFWLVVAIVAAVAIPGGCRQPDRPGVDAWEAAWLRTVRLLPVASAFRTGDSRARCEHALAALRNARHELFPTADPSLDGVVRQWFDLAQSIVFDCDPATGAMERFEQRAREASILHDEVQAALADLRARHGPGDAR